MGSTRIRRTQRKRELRIETDENLEKEDTRSPMRKSHYTEQQIAFALQQGEQVVEVLEGIASERGLPETIFCDNGPEFTSKTLDKWAYENGVTLNFSRPGKPTDNAIIESFNGHFRDECLNTNWFLSIKDAKSKIEAWRRHYNESRPHMALNYLTPQQYRASEQNLTPDANIMTGT